MSKHRNDNRAEIRRLRAELDWFKSITAMQSDSIENYQAWVNKLLNENTDLKIEIDKFTMAETVRLRSVSHISADSFLYSNVPYEKTEEFAKRNATEGLLHSLREFVEIKVEDAGYGNKVVTAEITVKRPLNEEYKGRMVFR